MPNSLVSENEHELAQEVSYESELFPQTSRSMIEVQSQLSSKSIS